MDRFKVILWIFLTVHGPVPLLAQGEQRCKLGIEEMFVLADKNSRSVRVSALAEQQALMVLMKELYGWLTLLGIFCLLLFMVKESDIRPGLALHPTYRTIRRWMKRELREDALK